MAWAFMSPLFAFAPAAEAAPPSECHWTDPNHIVCDGTSTYTKTAFQNTTIYRSDISHFIANINAAHTAGTFTEITQSPQTANTYPMALGSPANATTTPKNPPSTSLACSWTDKTLIQCGTEQFKFIHIAAQNHDRWVNSATSFIANVSANKTAATHYTMLQSGLPGPTNPVTLSNPANATKNPAAPGGGPTADKPVNCEAGAFTWLVCGSIKILVGVVDTITNDVIVPFLKEPPLDKNQNEFAPVYAIWSAFRNVASVFFILVFFLVIIGTALGFDNYTIKKVLPHLVAGAILMPFSWYLCAFLVDIGNVLGQGIVVLMTNIIIIGTPKVDLTSNFTTLFLGVGGGVGTFALIGAATILGFCAIISLLIAFAGVFLTLVFRKILILFLIIISPFALLAWVLPNTEKWFKEWWQNFLKLVMLYPIIMMLIEVGRLFSATATAASPGAICAAGDTACQATAWVAPFFAIAGLTVPLFIIPFAFKFAGKGLAAGSGAINKLGGGIDKKYGKDSALAKDLAEGRQRKNVAAAKIAESNAKSAHGLHKTALNRKAAMNWRRAGLAGSTGSAKLRRGEAVGKADKELSTIDADNRMSKEADPEDFRQRRLSTTQSILDEKAANRGARQGVLEGYNGAGAPGARDKQHQARINSRDNYLAAAGKAKGEIEDDALNERERVNRTGNYVSPSMKMAAAHDTAALSASDARGTARGIVEGGAEAERIIQSQTGLNAADARDLRLRNVAKAKSNIQSASAVTTQQTANTNVTANAELDRQQIAAAGGHMSPQQARSLRMQNLSAATHSQEREKIGAAEGQIDARNAITASAGQENMGRLVTGERMAAREQLSSARTLREARADFQATPEGYMSTADSLKASRLEANKRIGASIGAQKQEIAQEQEDIAKALRDGNPAPRLADHVIAGTEAAKSKTAQDSAQRLAAVNAVRTGTAASTRQHTDAAVYTAERSTAIADAAVKATASAVNAQIAAVAGEKGLSTAAAAQAVRTDNLKVAARAKEITTNAEFATTPAKDRGVIKAYEAAIEQAREAPLRKAKVAAFERADENARTDTYEQSYQIAKAAKMTDKAGKIVKDAAGNEVLKFTEGEARDYAAKARDTLGAERGQKAGREAADKITAVGKLNSADAERAVIASSATAAEELAMRTEASSQAQTAALNQAVESSATKLDARERLAVQTEGSVATLAAESGAARARYDLTRPGQSLNQSYQAAEDHVVKSERLKIIGDRVEKAGNEDFTFMGKDGVPHSDSVKNADLGPDGVKAQDDEIRRLLKDGYQDPENEDRALALVGRLSLTGSGRERVRAIQRDLFGRTEDQLIDPTRFKGRASELWEIVQSKNKSDVSKDFFMPEPAAYDGYSSSEFGRSGWGEKKNYFEFAKRVDKDNIYDESTRNIQQALTNAQVTKELNSDDYAQMWIYMQDPKALTALATRDTDAGKGKTGLDIVKKIYASGGAAEAEKRWLEKQGGDPSRNILKQYADSGFTVLPPVPPPPTP